MNAQLGETFPLPTMTIEQAIEFQHELTAAVMDNFDNNSMFQADFGVNPLGGQPETTRRVEKTLAQAFGTDDAVLVQGAGTGAIRQAVSAAISLGCDRRLTVHDAPVYSTTGTTFNSLAIDEARVDFNDSNALQAHLESPDSPDWFYIQHSRQQLSDSYDPLDVTARAVKAGKRLISDENYAVIRTPQISTHVGASAAAFSLFKLHGPVGVGVVIGDQDLVDQIRTDNYSGGSQVQGDQALFALQQLVMTPVNWAIQSKQVFDLADMLNNGKVPGVTSARIANAQDLCVIVQLDSPRAAEVRQAAVRYGAAGFPVGSNSRYEITPLVYRMSSSSLASAPELADYCIRINPMRASAQSVVDVLSRAIADTQAE